jgi:hypothetical protein
MIGFTQEQAVSIVAGPTLLQALTHVTNRQANNL